MLRHAALALCIVGGSLVAVQSAPAPDKSVQQTSVGLPAFSDEGAVRLCLLPGDAQAACRLEIENPKSAKLGTVYTVKADKEPGRWTIQLSSREPALIATLRFRDNDLRFYWKPEIKRSQAAGLRNCVLHVDAGTYSQSILLRAPAEAEPTALDLRRNLNTIKVTADDLPDPDQLTLEMTGLRGYRGIVVIDPPSKRVGFKEPATLRLKGADANSPGVEFQVVLMTNGSAMNLNVRPLAVPEKGPALPFTLQNVADATKILKTQISTAKSTIASNDKAIPQIQAKLGSISGATVRNASERAALEQQIATYQAQIRTMKEQNVELKKALPVVQKRLDAMPALSKPAIELHQKAALDFRVLYQIGDREAELFATAP